MRALLPLIAATFLLTGCPEPPAPGECSESAKVTGYRDEDRDGHGDPATQEQVCAVGVGGWVPTGLDCDDTRPNVNPDSLEECDGLDNDCDNTVDEGLRQLDYYQDADNDGFGDIDSVSAACSPPEGFVENSSDCDDGDPLSFPGSEEFCDGEDNDCDGLVDDADPSVDPESQPWWYIDADQDGYGDPDAGLQRCNQPTPAYVDNMDDCNDSSAGISPAAQEVCDAIDNDCDGLIDDSDPSLDPVGVNRWYYDGDGDGYGDANEFLDACNQPWFYVGDANDCDDSNPDITTAGETFWLTDADGDGFGDPGSTLEGPDCAPPAATGYAPQAAGDDCDDTNPAINPDATEICDAGVDNDCDGLIDDADDDVDLTTATTWYADADGDTYGDAAFPVDACTQPADTSQNGNDCNDADPAIYPGALEVCNGFIDDDCDGLADEDDPNLDPASAPQWFQDFDQDGFGCPQAECGVTVSCTQPVGDFVANDIDCDDNDDTIGGDGDWLADTDGDGFGTAVVVATGCGPFPDATPDLGGPTDCDDTDPLTYPGASEICGDTFDQDCDGADQLCPPDTCVEAQATTPLNSDTRYVDDLSLYIDDVNFADLNSCTGAPTDGADAIIPIDVAPGENVAAWMVGTGDTSVYLLSSCTAPDPSADCAVGADNVGGNNSERVWYANTSAVTETLYLVADCNGPCSDYELEILFNQPDLPDTCVAVAGVPPLTTGGHSYAGSLDGLADNADLGPIGCTGFDSSGGEVFLPVDLSAGETVSVLDYVQELDDASTYVMTSCADPFGTCLVGADLVGSGQSETLGYTNGGGTTQRVYLALDCNQSLCRDYVARIAID